MTQLLEIRGDVPTVSTLTLAEGAGVTHESVIKQVRKHVADLERFGLIGFEIRPRPPGTHGGSSTEFARLNEQQASLILTYMKNTEIVRGFKIRLIEEFYAMRDKLRASASAPPPIKNPVMQLIVAQAMELDRIEQGQQAQAARIEALETRVAAQDPQFYTTSAYAAMINMRAELEELQVFGKQATRMSNSRGYPVHKVKDRRWGLVGSYHVDILRELMHP